MSIVAGTMADWVSFSLDVTSVVDSPRTRTALPTYCASYPSTSAVPGSLRGVALRNTLNCFSFAWSSKSGLPSWPRAYARSPRVNRTRPSWAATIRGASSRVCLSTTMGSAKKGSMTLVRKVGKAKSDKPSKRVRGVTRMVSTRVPSALAALEPSKRKLAIPFLRTSSMV